MYGHVPLADLCNNEVAITVVCVRVCVRVCACVRVCVYVNVGVGTCSNV